MTIQTDVQPVDDATVATEAAPPMERAPVRGRSEGLRRELRFAGPIIGMVLGIKLLVYSYGAVVAETLDQNPFTHWIDRFEIWNRWDAVPYLQLSQSGYLKSPIANATHIVFLPGYPLAIRAINDLLPGGSLTAALIVSGIASVAAALLLAHLVRIDTGDEARAHRAAWFLLIFPTAYFLHLPYTESLFLALMLGSFVAARSGRWATAGLLGALAAFTRLNGVLLIPALAVEAYLQYREHRRLEWRWLWIAAISTGTIIYLGINQHLYGSLFHFQDVQRSNWHKYFANPYTTIKGMIHGAPTWKPWDRQMIVIQELLFMAIGLVAAVLAFFKTRASYGVWALLNVFVFASTAYIQSTPRYVITIFPIFLLLASIDRQVWLSRVVSAWSLLMMAWFAMLFATGHWAF